MKNLSLFYILNRIAFLLSVCIIFVVFMSIIKDVQNNRLQAVWTYGIGYVLILLALYCSLLMRRMMNGKNKDQRKNSIIISV